ncbi:MAG: hypothetical protein CMB75_04560 [Euryarchaeota archaeon]|nr:hypothetical protein [Euryarchaeota archaeon]
MGIIPRRKKKGKLPPLPPPPPPPPLDGLGGSMMPPPPPQNPSNEDYDSLVPIGGGQGTVTTPELGEYDQEWSKKTKDPAEEDLESLWSARKAANIGVEGLDGMYGHIDRIAKGERGSLINRFSDRFGTELDREIIVMRKEQQQIVRDIAPVVELIEKPNDTDHLTLDEFIHSMDQPAFIEKVSDATGISTDMLSSFEEEELVEFFQTADVDESGTMEFEEFAEAITRLKQANDDFAKLFSIVDTLLGNQDSKFIQTFTESDAYELYKKVGMDPHHAPEDDRRDFFALINEVLGDLPASEIEIFTQSEDFEHYKTMGEALQ